MKATLFFLGMLIIRVGIPAFIILSIGEFVRGRVSPRHGAGGD